ncbi:protein kinase [Thermogemmatispora sp.]|uniref:protein kinase domain-containing protein n=1 Tax=Thermogemmatispora sp. TaxID=1968838 RepID=UPI0035E4322A
MSQTFSQESFCDHCGAANPAGATHCWHCQEPLATSQAAPGALLVGRYRLLHELGRGGMGTVFLAEDQRLGARQVALKRLYKRRLSPEECQEAEQAFQQEAGLLARLRHPSLPAIHDYWSEPDASYLVMDYIEGETLEAIQQHAGQRPLPLGQVLDWARQLCQVLIYLHEQQPPIIFRDLKPANIMRRRSDGRLLLIDFGIARHFKPGKAHDTIALGSPGFAAPEQYGREQTTPRSDLYALGAVLHCLLSGHDPSEQPFRFAPLEQLNPEVPEELAHLIAQLLAMDPEQRPPSARAVLDRLEPLARRHKGKHQKGKVTKAPGRRRQPKPSTPSGSAGAPLPGAVSSPQPAAGGAGQAQKQRRAKALTPWQRYRLRQQRAQAAARARMAASGIWSRRLLLGLGLGLGGFLLWRLSAKTLGSLLASREEPDASEGASPNLLLPTLTFQGHSDWVTAIAWSPDGTLLASASSDHSVHLWDSGSGRPVGLYRGHQSDVLALSWSPDGVYIASAASDGVIHIWEARSGQRRLSYRAHRGPVTALAWFGQPASPILASAGDDGLVRIWNGQRGQLLMTYRGHSGSVHALAWKPSSDLLASAGDDGTVQIWEAVSGGRKLLYQGHSRSVTSLAWSPDSRLLASGSADTTVQVWEATSGQRLQTYQGHYDTVTGLSWSPQSDVVASCSYDGTLQLWESTSGRPLSHARGAAFLALAWSPASSLLATGDESAQVQIWQAP